MGHSRLHVTALRCVAKDGRVKSKPANQLSLPARQLGQRPWRSEEVDIHHIDGSAVCAYRICRRVGQQRQSAVVLVRSTHSISITGLRALNRS